ncbi:hypothetical protein KDL45_16440 [bacterium]|nr:hypothetical protein [bacterium]
MSPWVAMFALLSWATMSSAADFQSAKTDGRGTYDASGIGNTRLVAMDADGDGRAEAVAELWGVELLRGRVDTDGDGTRECLLIPNTQDDEATWYLRQSDGRYLRLRTGEQKERIAKARELWGALIQRRAAMDFGDVETKDADPASASALLGTSDGVADPSTLRIVIFHSRAAAKGATPRDAGTIAADTPKTMPITLPPIGVRDDVAATARFDDLTMALGPYEESGSVRAAAAMNVFVFTEAERDATGATADAAERHVQIGARVTIEGRVDDHFVVFDDLTGGTTFANVPAEDPAGRTDGSWTLEMHETP